MNFVPKMQNRWVTLAICIVFILSLSTSSLAAGFVAHGIQVSSDAEITHGAKPGPGSKNYDPAPLFVAADLPTDLAVVSTLLTCDESGDFDWTTTSATYEIIRQCTLQAPGDGWVFITADASLGVFDTDENIDDSFEAHFRIGIDSLTGDPATDRKVNVYENDNGDGTDKSVALSVRKAVSAGTHTFYFLGRQGAGPGMVNLYDPTLTVKFFPAANSSILTCGSSGDTGETGWTTTSGSYSVLRQCSISVPQNGQVFIAADGSVGMTTGGSAYTAQFRIGINDPVTGDSTTDRFVNVAPDGVDGTDKSVAISTLQPVTTGSRTFYFLGRRSAGAGTVRVLDPTLTVIFIPDNSSELLSCSAPAISEWTTTSAIYSVVNQCTINSPREALVLITANGSLGIQDNAYEAQFRIGIDNSTEGDSTVDRWVNAYTDASLGTDETVAISVLKPVAPGNHTFYLLARRFTGTGTVQIQDPTLTVLLLPVYKTYLPLTLRR